MSKLPEPFRTLSAEIRKLREEVRQLRNRSALDGTGWSVADPDQVVQSGSVTIPDNGLLLVDGGDVTMLDVAPSATVLFSLGQQQYGDRGITISRNDGSKALEIRDVFDTGNQAMLLYDSQGHIIAGDSVLSFTGFDAPHMPIPFIPVDYTSAATAQTTSSASFVALHEHRGFRQNPALKLQLMVKCSDGTTSAQVQVWDVVNSAYLGGFLGSPVTHTITVPIGTTAFTLFEFSSALALPGVMSADMRLEIHVKRTAGAGSVSVAPVRSIGSGF